MKSKTKSLLPVEIKLPEGVLLDDGTMFVVLKTLAELEEFWQLNSQRFTYAARGIIYGSRQFFLGENEWIFASTKKSLVKAVTRWDQIGIRCEFYDWSKNDPDMWRFFFDDRENYRKSKVKEGCWSADDEAEFQKRTPETYRGWWKIGNLPKEMEDMEWFSVHSAVEVIDPRTSEEVVEATLQEETFDDWKAGDVGELEFLDHSGVAEYILYLQNEEKEIQTVGLSFESGPDAVWGV